MIRDLRFLTAQVDLTAARKGLLVQSGSADLLAKAIDLLRTKLPDLELTVLRQRGMEERFPLRTDVHYRDNDGSKLQMLRALRASRFDVVFVLYSNESGFWKLKLLPYFLAAEGVLAVNEHLGWFPVTLQTTDQFAQHMRWRLESSMTVAPGGVAPLLAGIGKSLTYPATLAYLVAFERWKNFGLRSRKEGANWKSPEQHS
jgi:hypothetical protein